MTSYFSTYKSKSLIFKRTLKLVLPLIILLLFTSCESDSDIIDADIDADNSIISFEPFEISFESVEDSSAIIQWNNPYKNLSEVSYSLKFKGHRVIGDSVSIEDLIISDYLDTTIVFSKILVPKFYYEVEIEAISTDTTITHSEGFRTLDIDFRSTIPTDIVRYDPNIAFIRCIDFEEGFLTVLHRNRNGKTFQELLFLDSNGNQLWKKEVGFYFAEDNWELVVNLESYNSEIILYLKKGNTLILRHYDPSGNKTRETIVLNSSQYDFIYRNGWQSGDLKWNGKEYIAAFTDQSNKNSKVYFTRISTDGNINVIDSLTLTGLYSHIELTDQFEYIISVNEDHQSGADYLMMTDLNGNVKWSTHLKFIFTDGFIVKKIKYDSRHGVYFIASAVFTYPYTATVPVITRLSPQGVPLWVNSASYSQIKTQMQDLIIREDGGALIAGGIGRDQTPLNIYEFDKNGYYMWHSRFYPYDDFRNNNVAGVFPSDTGGILLFATATNNLGLEDEAKLFPYFVTLNEFGRL